jgi:hypothetical protein
MIPTHDLIQFTGTKNAGIALVQVKKQVDDEMFNILSNFFDDNLKRNGKSSQWYVKVEDAASLCHQIDKIVEDLDNEEEESDDELIQQALARRFKSESSGKVIEEHTLEDSEDEDVISLSRRIRHLYKVIDELQRK